MDADTMNTHPFPGHIVQVIGLHTVMLEAPAHLFEIAVHGSTGPFEIRQFTQGMDGPVPYREFLLDATGNTVLADGMALSMRPELWVGELRMSFLMRSLKLTMNLRTPFGPVELPRVTPIPMRLRLIYFHAP